MAYLPDSCKPGAGWLKVCQPASQAVTGLQAGLREARHVSQAIDDCDCKTAAWLRKASRLLPSIESCEQASGALAATLSHLAGCYEPRLDGMHGGLVPRPSMVCWPAHCCAMRGRHWSSCACAHGCTPTRVNARDHDFSADVNVVLLSCLRLAVQAWCIAPAGAQCVDSRHVSAI